MTPEMADDMVAPEMADDDLREAVEAANLPTLLPVLVQLTGDRRWLDDPYRPARPRGLGDDDTGGLSPELRREVREAAVAALLAWRRGRPLAEPEPSAELLVTMLSWCMGEPVPSEYGPMIAAELGVRSPRPTPTAAPAGFRVLVIGAGVAGLCAAVDLARAGIPYVVVERNDDVGGVWLENTYPGVGVDTPSHLYEFSFAPYAWSRYFAGGEEIRSYLRHVAERFDVRRHVRFGTEVAGASWDADGQAWDVDLRSADGTTQTLRCSALISGVGAFNKPRLPDLPGLDDFAGPCAHTARWPADVELAGARVGVIGNGASAMQVVPAVADDVAELVVFQRSAQWAAPFEKFRMPVPAPVRRLMTAVPLYQRWYRLRQAWLYNDRLHDALQRDPEWPDPERSVNRVNDAHRRFFLRHLESELGERTDLRDAVVPDYPPYGKRILLDNGWYRTLRRDHVSLVTDAVDEIRPGSVVAGSVEYPLDVLVLATGFDVVHYLAPMTIRGRSGTTLAQHWDGDDARAYLGTTVPDFPNLFCLYGPNTQTGHGGSVMFMIELQMHYVMTLLSTMFDRGLAVAECRQDVHDEYNARVDAAHERMVWTHPGMDTYYRNERGRVVVNNPFRVIDFFAMTRDADLGEYHVEPARD